jgi:hypothetical protein
LLSGRVRRRGDDHRDVHLRHGDDAAPDAQNRKEILLSALREVLALAEVSEVRE